MAATANNGCSGEVPGGEPLIDSALRVGWQVGIGYIGPGLQDKARGLRLSIQRIRGWHLLLVAGIPAVGKSTLCRYLNRAHGFAHYDLECHPRGWPAPDLKAVWDQSRAQFIAALRARHERVALDWGFPPRCIEWVRELQGAGARLVWLSGDASHARRIYLERGGFDERDFDRQMADIVSAGYPQTLNTSVFPGLTEEGQPRTPADITEEIFPEQAR